MKFELKNLEVTAGRPIIFINEKVAEKINVHPGDRLKASFKSKSLIAKIDLVANTLAKNQIYLSNEIRDFLQVKPGQTVKLDYVTRPRSSIYITKKMNGKVLSKKEIFSIIKDVVDNALTEVEIAQFVVAVYKNGMNYGETVHLTEAMFKTGSVLKWPSKTVADKHCIGGIAGNRTTPIVVSICAAAGIIMPKTSSRAITSAAGTADVIETLSDVDFPVSKLKKIVGKTNACLAWGGSLGLAPADDKLIKVERILNLDPESQLLASILSKKLAAGSKYVLIDIPFGPGAKVSLKEAYHLKKSFLKLAKSFNLKMQVVLTDGRQPIGNGIGPVLEMQDVLKVLKRDNPPEDLEKKAVYLAGLILEMVKKASAGKGEELAYEILNSGKAYEKFNQIINEQGKSTQPFKTAKFEYILKAQSTGKISVLDNKLTNYTASILGCPQDKGSGIYLIRKLGDKVVKGDSLAIFYTESKTKLQDAIDFFSKKPFATIL